MLKRLMKWESLFEAGIVPVMLTALQFRSNQRSMLHLLENVDIVFPA